MGDSPCPPARSTKSETLVIQAESDMVCAPVPHLKGDLKSLVLHEANVSVLEGDADLPQNLVVQQEADMV